MNKLIAVIILMFNSMIFKIVSSQSEEQILGKTEFEIAADDLAKKNVLEYGEKCSADDEKKRIALGDELVEFAFKRDEAQLPRLTSMITELVQSPGQFCNTFKNLQCNSTGLCTCGSSDALGMRVRTVRQNGVCRLNRGSACAPQEALPTVGGQKQDLRCQDGLECVMKNSTQIECTEATYQEDIRKYVGKLKTRDPQKILKALREKLASGVCVCEGEDIIEETSTTPNSTSSVRTTVMPTRSANSKYRTASSSPRLHLVSPFKAWIFGLIFYYTCNHFY